MNFYENSNSLNLSKNILKQKKLDYFGIIGNLIQGKGKGKNIVYVEEIQSENVSTKRKNDENIKSIIMVILQKFEGLLG